MTPRRGLAALLIAGVAVAAALAVVLSAGAASGSGVGLQQVGRFNTPLSIAAPRHDPAHVYVVEQAGTIRVMTNGHTAARPFLDIRSIVSSGGERGLLSMAFAPDFATSHHFYVYYTGKGRVVSHEGDIEIDRFTASSATKADVGSRVRVITIAHHAEANHNGGQLQFGPDGMLYFGTGDGGGGGDTQGNGQNLTHVSSDGGSDNHSPLLGKLLRIAPGAGGGYTIPAGNPFKAPAAPVWMLGLRNPWRWSFDRKTGDIVIGDVGQGLYEEVDFARSPGAGKVGGRGVNYGWNRREGFHAFAGSQEARGPNFKTDPVLEQPHSAGWLAIIGGYVERDPSVPELAGTYLYGDNVKGQLWGAKLSAGHAGSNRALGISVPGLSGMGEDACGRVYVALLNGAVDRVVSRAHASKCTAALAR